MPNEQVQTYQVEEALSDPCGTGSEPLTATVKLRVYGNDLTLEGIVTNVDFTPTNRRNPGEMHFTIEIPEENN